MKISLLWDWCCLILFSSVGLSTSNFHHKHNIETIENGYLYQNSEGNLKYLYTTVDPIVQESTAQKAAERILGVENSQILIKVNPHVTGSIHQEGFSVTYDDKKEQVIITGTTGVTALYGLNDYLKYHCNCHMSWEGNQLQLPSPLPSVKYKRKIFDRFRYYQNVCTDSYSFVWWDWPRWEKEIDLMALYGINMPLAFTGQEAIWQRVYLKLGLQAQDVFEYISGPAFLAWWRMGNIQKWGGPTPQNFVEKKLVLLHKILQRMRNVGMLPVLPAFAGNVPVTLKKIYPNITLIQHLSWNHFNSSYATFMLEPTDPLFHEIGSRFMKEMVGEVGTNHIYSCDTFNENDPKKNTSEFLRDSAKATYNAIESVDSKAVWMMQSWVFRSKFWQQEQVKAFLSGVPIGNALVLDLEAELTPLYKKFNSFFGHSFIWCMLQNFGGTMSLYGAFDLVNNGIADARANVTSGQFVGVGSCPEGINQNSVMFDFLYEVSLHSERVNLTQWIQSYAKRRYGTTNGSIRKAWNILQNGIYNAPVGFSNHGRSIITRRPSLKLSDPKWYKLMDIQNIMAYFINAATTSEICKNSTLYQHDLVDFSRQFLELTGAEIYKGIIKNYKLKKFDKFKKTAKQLVELLDDLEILLKTSDKFLLGKWVQSAESWGENYEEKKLLRYNALNQITLWGPSGEIVDYAAKQWAGTVGSYYKPRWVSFLEALNSSLASGRSFNSKHFQQNVLQNIEIPFTLSSHKFPVVPEGNSISEAIRIYSRWAKTFRRFVRRGRKQKNASKIINQL